MSLVETTQKLLKMGRCTLVEHVFFEAISQAFTQKPDLVEEAKANINVQVRGFSAGKIDPVSDLHKCVWGNAQRIVKNRAIQ